MEKKNIEVPTRVHKLVKIQATERDMKMNEYIAYLVALDAVVLITEKEGNLSFSHNQESDRTGGQNDKI